jgi:serine/threonine protein kinase
MQKINDYRIINKIYESNNSIVYHVYKQNAEIQYILKLLATEYPSQPQLLAYHNEYKILQQINSDNVIRAYELGKFEGKYFIILEDIKGLSLKELLKDNFFTFEQKLKLSIQIANAIAQVHSQNIIHKDINPSNIIYSIKSEQLKLIDFGLSTILQRETPVLQSPSSIQGTLPYLSPEQTGRMNRFLDYRTDFYSFGATLYELFTRQQPFEAQDPMELVHCHLAKIPISPYKVNGDIPQAISDIIMKLMSKTVEERYQSAWGIKNDLEQCLQQWQTQKVVFRFPLAQKDISHKLQIPQKLYGREKQIETLFNCFQNTIETSTANLMLVSGHSGIGKTVLIKEIYKPLTQQHGYFIHGKFDQLQRNTPYTAIIQSLKSLMRQLLTEDSMQLAKWRQSILEKLGDNGQLIIDVIPEVETIIGAQPAMRKLPPQEAKNRFHLTFQNFLSIFCNQAHPLVIFLDDLQWADNSSLHLIQAILEHNQYLFIICAYRDNEVDANHPLMDLIAKIEATGIQITNLKLTALDFDSINQLVADTLNKDTKDTASLSQLIQDKTDGNPFFINELLNSLYQKEILNFIPNEQQWRWDVQRIKNLQITENVVNLVMDKVQSLSTQIQHILQFASCIGNGFEVNTLSIITEIEATDLTEYLIQATNDGLLINTDKSYQFIHDKVQQGIYSSIFEAQRNEIHYKIGRLLYQHFSTESQYLFDIVDHLNFGSSFITTHEEKRQLIILNLQVGKKAKQAAAYKEALNYLQQAMDILAGFDCWQIDYALTLEVYHEAIEVAFLSGDLIKMKTLSQTTLQQAQTVLDMVHVYDVNIQAFAIQRKLLEAIEMGKDILAQLDESFPKNVKPVHILTNLIKTKLLLSRKQIESLRQLPRMHNPGKLMLEIIEVQSGSYLEEDDIVRYEDIYKR